MGSGQWPPPLRSADPLAVPIAVLLLGALMTTMIVRRKNFVEPARQAAAVTG